MRAARTEVWHRRKGGGVTLPRDEVVAGFPEEMGRFEALIRSLDAEAWERPTRCEGWRVADVAAHVAGQLADINAGHFDGLGTPEVTQREVDERRGRSPRELADELHEVVAAGQATLAAIDDEAWKGPAPGDLDIPLGEGVEALWYDAWLHADDIRAALGRAPERSPGLRASVFHVSTLLEAGGWGPATLALDGLEEVIVGDGSGRRVTGDPHQFVLVATGRADPATLGLDESVNVYR
jgi:uncharacterized protein (TIGR03083 family)